MTNSRRDHQACRSDKIGRLVFCGDVNRRTAAEGEAVYGDVGAQLLGGPLPLQDTMKGTFMNLFETWRVKRLHSQIADCELEIRMIKKELFLVGNPAPAYIVADLEDAQERLEKYKKKLATLQNG